MFCKKCGKKIEEHSKFCDFCGANLSSVESNNNMKKLIQILSIILKFFAVVSYIGIIKTAIGWEKGNASFKDFIFVILFSALIHIIYFIIEKKYPKTVQNAEDIVYTEKELQERNAGIDKNPIFIKILLAIPATFAILVVLFALYIGYLFLTGEM